MTDDDVQGCIDFALVLRGKRATSTQFKALAPPDEHWDPFTSLDRRILLACLHADTLTFGQIADETGERNRERLKVLVEQLVERKILLVKSGGYALDADDEERALVKQWLAVL